MYTSVSKSISNFQCIFSRGEERLHHKSLFNINRNLDRKICLKGRLFPSIYKLYQTKKSLGEKSSHGVCGLGGGGCVAWGGKPLSPPDMQPC